MSERYRIKESEKYFGKYTVVDTVTQEVRDFYNLASARTWIKDQIRIDKAKLDEK